MKIKSNESGKCPFCNSDNLDYGVLQVADFPLIYYPWKCNDCQHEGEEYYQLEFSGHNVFDENGNNIEIFSNMIER